jgi:head-tail adaptor
MNAILCYMKMKKYNDMISLCNMVLEKPRHGHQFKDLKIVGPGHAKVEGTLSKQ